MRVHWGVVSGAGDFTRAESEGEARRAAEGLGPGHRVACFAELSEVASHIEGLAKQVPAFLSPSQAVQFIAFAIGALSQGQAAMDQMFAAIRSRGKVAS